VAENVFLNRLPLAPVFNRVDWSRVRSEAEAIFTQLGVSIDVGQRVRSLGLAQRQLTEIARVLAMNVRILIMDEPTSSLTAGESEHLFTLLEGLRRRGVGIIYITHHVDEAFRLAQRITVLRDGHRVATLEAAAAQPGAVVGMMVGRPLSQQYPKRTAERGAPALEVRDLHVRGVLHGVNLTVHHGEVVGLFGMMGAGRTELARALFGLERIDSGQILIDGRPVALHSPQEAIAQGLGLLTEERNKDGLVLQLAVDKNITLPSLTSFSRFGIMQRRRERTIAARYVRAMNIDTPSLERPVRLLSGGNQQKIALAKWLCTQSKVLIFDEPTRGIDVGAKVDVYELMNHLTENGVAVLMISSELPEVVAMSDRVLVMRQGTISAAFARDQATQEAIMRSSVKDKEG
jgi:ABC-type sugar transport system ATPase subunit